MKSAYCQQKPWPLHCSGQMIWNNSFKQILDLYSQHGTQKARTPAEAGHINIQPLWCSLDIQKQLAFQEQQFPIEIYHMPTDGAVERWTGPPSLKSWIFKDKLSISHTCMALSSLCQKWLDFQEASNERLVSGPPGLLYILFHPTAKISVVCYSFLIFQGGGKFV